MIAEKDLKPMYRKIYNLALPYYEKGREAEDVHHLAVTGIMINLLKEVDLDEEVMIASSLLHDIGYASLTSRERKGYRGKDKQYLPEGLVRRHMASGAKIAREILYKLEFPENKIQKVCKIIATHDNPKLGLPLKTKEQKLLKEADNLWMTTEEAFWLDVKRRRGMTAQDWLKILETRFTKEKQYTDYFTTRYAKRRVKEFLSEMKSNIGKS